MTYPEGVRTRAIDLLVTGESKDLICKDLGVKRVTLDKWLKAERVANPGRIPRFPMPPLKNNKVGDVRILLRMLDGELLKDDTRSPGMSLRAVHQETGVDRQTIRRWRDDPKYREATLEYDPSFPYSIDDLLDRATVAQHLASQTTDVGERLDLLMAAVGFGERDDFSVPSSWSTKGRMS